MKYETIRKDKIKKILKKYDNISKFDETEEAYAFYGLYKDIEELIEEA